MTTSIVKAVETQPVGFAPILKWYFERCNIAKIIDIRKNGHGVEIARFFFHLFMVEGIYVTTSENRCTGCPVSHHLQGALNDAIAKCELISEKIWEKNPVKEAGKIKD